MNLTAILESMLYVSGDEGLTKDEITSILEVTKDTTDKLILELSNLYKNENSGLEVKCYGNLVKLVTKEKYSEYLQKLFNEQMNEKLSPSALETLAIIAYNEPITRIMVDEIRGVSSAHIIRKLVFRNLVRDLGRSELPGKPMLYGVTEQFLDHFGLSSIEELPKLEVEEREEESQDLFTSKYTEI